MLGRGIKKIMLLCWLMHAIAFTVSPVVVNKYLQPHPKLIIDRLTVYGSTLLSLLLSTLNGPISDTPLSPIVKAFIQLGPAAIKIGQSLASRPDLIGVQLASSLQSLQDNVPSSLSFEEVEQILSQSFFNTTINMTSLSRTPVAAASIGQVHRATLLDEHSTPVAIKIQRPMVRENVGCDLFLVGLLAKAIQPFLESKAVEVINELSMRIFEEMDYRKEADNLQLFSSLYNIHRGGTYAAELPFPGVITPQLYPSLCNEKVLTMGYIEGVKLVKYDKLPREKLLQITSLGLRCSLSQLLISGCLHADPHGGNLMIEEQSGRLCYLDFGLVAQIPRKVRLALLCAVIHLVEQDFDALAAEFDDLMLLSTEHLQVNKVKLANALREVVSKIFVFGPEELNSEPGIEGDLLSKMPTLKFDKIVSSLASIATEFPFQSPPYFLNNVRAIGTLEGMALSADPNFNLFRIVYPFMLTRIFCELDEPKINSLFKNLILSKETGLVNWRKTVKLVRQACTIGGVRKRDLLTSFVKTKSGPRLLIEIMMKYVKHCIRRLRGRKPSRPSPLLIAS